MLFNGFGNEGRPRPYCCVVSQPVWAHLIPGTCVFNYVCTSAYAVSAMLDAARKSMKLPQASCSQATAAAKAAQQAVQPPAEEAFANR